MNVVLLNQVVVTTKQNGHVERAFELVFPDHCANAAGNHSRADNILVQSEVMKAIRLNEEAGWGQRVTNATDPPRAGASGVANLGPQQGHVFARLVFVRECAHD